MIDIDLFFLINHSILIYYGTDVFLLSLAGFSRRFHYFQLTEQ